MHESHTVNAESPCKNRNIKSQSLCHLGAEDTAASQLEPAENRMLDMHLDTWLREREIAGNVFDFSRTCNFLCKHLQQSEKVSQIHVLADDNAFCLVEIRTVRRINLIIAETACDTEILSRNLRMRKLCC